MSTNAIGTTTLDANYGTHEAGFDFASAEVIAITTTNGAEMAMRFSNDARIAQLTVVTHDDQRFELLCARPSVDAKWLMRDSRQLGATYFALRRGNVFRNGTRVDPEYLSGIGVSSDFKTMIRLDGYGRRWKEPVGIKEAHITCLG
ncbi:MAG: hypothetical protein WAS27_01540 [Candidatus Saccharimonadales bacterium]